jgi:hypothetical protein
VPIPNTTGAPTELVTLDDVKTQLQIPATTGNYDDQLQGYIDAATAYIQQATGPILNRTCTEVHSGGGLTIVLDDPPVLTVTSVTEYVGPTAYPLTQAELGTATGAYAFSLDDPQAGIICRRFTGGLAGRFAGGYRNVQVVYVAGVVAVDPSIRFATLMDIQGLWTQTQEGGPSTAFGGQIGETGSDGWTASPSNPIGAFPRLAAMLEGNKRTPAIA